MTVQGGEVVVGVDGSDANRTAVAWAAWYAQRCGARLTLLGVWHWPPVHGTAIPMPYAPELDRQRTEAAVDEAAARTELPPTRLRLRVVEGKPGPELVRASRDAALLVVGHRGDRPAGAALLGSVSSYCIHHAHVPVVVVPATGAAVDRARPAPVVARAVDTGGSTPDRPGHQPTQQR